MCRKLLLVLLPVVFLCLCGCAVLNRDNRHTFNLVRDKLVPRDQSPTVGHYCLLVPAGFIAVTLDALIVHPVTVFDEAWLDTASALWSGFRWDERYVTECAMLPFRAALTPFVYLPCWLARAAFDIGEEEANPPEVPVLSPVDVE